MIAYTAGSNAAHEVPGTSPALLARRRLQAACESLDAATARLAACGVAEAVANHYEKRYKDAGAAAAIAAARDFAYGNLTEWARQNAETSARKMTSRTGRRTGVYNHPFHCAATAAGWCLNRDARKGLYWASIWAVACERDGDQVAALAYWCDVLERLNAAGSGGTFRRTEEVEA